MQSSPLSYCPVVELKHKTLQICVKMLWMIVFFVYMKNSFRHSYMYRAIKLPRKGQIPSKPNHNVVSISDGWFEDSGTLRPTSIPGDTWLDLTLDKWFSAVIVFCWIECESIFQTQTNIYSSLSHTYVYGGEWTRICNFSNLKFDFLSSNV